MKQIDNYTSLTSHQKLAQLLPWYVNKSLQGSELEAVENHLGVCLTCKRELLQLQKLAQAVIHDSPLDSAENASFARLKQRLHGNGQPSSTSQPRQTVAQPGFAANVSQLGKAKTNGWAGITVFRPALAMAAAVLLTLTIVMPNYTGLDVMSGNNFRTLSNAQVNPMAGSEIRVVFADHVSQAQKNNIIKRVQGRVIDKPTAQGVYTVQLDKDVAAKHLLDTVELLRKDSNVIFAEPAYALLSTARVEEKK